MAARAGIEPATKWLTATCSTAELPGNQSLPPRLPHEKDFDRDEIAKSCQLDFMRKVIFLHLKRFSSLHVLPRTPLWSAFPHSEEIIIPDIDI